MRSRLLSLAVLATAGISIAINIVLLTRLSVTRTTAEYWEAAHQRLAVRLPSVKAARNMIRTTERSRADAKAIKTPTNGSAKLSNASWWSPAWNAGPFNEFQK